MAFVYRYIDVDKAEVVYVGKVTKEKDLGFDPLLRRHQQHKREDWYKQINKCVMQFIEVKSHADADILETYLISLYNTGQLVNIAKTDWGECSIDLYPAVFGKWRAWRTFGKNGQANKAELMSVMENIVDEFLKSTYSESLDGCLDYVTSRIKELHKEVCTAEKLSTYDAQDLFLRVKKDKT